MNIVLATDDNFVQHCSVTMLSILKHNSDVVFYILTEGLSESNVSMLNNIVAENGGDIYICNVDKEVVKRFPMPADADAHISVATYYRLLTEFILPQSVDKYIYMDCDMVVRGNMLELWNENVENYAIGAVFQSVSLAQEQDKNRLGIPEKMVILTLDSSWLISNIGEKTTYQKDFWTLWRTHIQGLNSMIKMY